jgi:AcrR family transcriptional regulator
MSTTRAKQAESTRQTLIRVGRRLFAQRGFDGVSGEEIVAAARVTRGALYHHFDGKAGLFRAVVSDAMSDVQERVARAASAARSPLKAVELGIRAFLAACAEPEYQRLLLIDGPAVLGWHAWRALDLEYGLGLLRRGLEAAAAARQVVVPDVETTTQLLAGALLDGAMLVGRDARDASVRGRVELAVLNLLHGLVPPRRKRQRAQ